MLWYMLLDILHVRLITWLALLGCTRCWHCMLRAVLLTRPERPRAGVVLPARGLASRAATRHARAANERTRLICVRSAEALASAERRCVRERGHAGDFACLPATRHASAVHEFEGLRRVQAAEAPYRAGHELRPQSRRARLEFESELDAPAQQGRGRLIARIAEHAAASAGLGEALTLRAGELVGLVVSAEGAATVERSRVAEAVATVYGARGAEARRALAWAAEPKAPLLRPGLRRRRRRRRRRRIWWRRRRSWQWRRGWLRRGWLGWASAPSARDLRAAAHARLLALA